MKTNRHLCWAASLLASAVVCHQAAAFDNGNPWFPEPGEGFFRVEEIFERYHRDLRVNFGTGTITRPSLGVIGTVASFSDDQVEENSRVMIRFTYFPASPIALQFDLGTGGRSSGGDSVFIIGGTGRVLLFNEKNFQIATQLGAHFIPEYSIRDSGVSTIEGPFEVRGEHNTYEISWSLLGSSQFLFENERKLILYGGPRLSAYHGDFDEDAYFPNTDTTVHMHGKVKQDSIFSIVLGGIYEFNPRFSIRTEARLVQEASITGALNWSY